MKVKPGKVQACASLSDQTGGLVDSLAQVRSRWLDVCHWGATGVVVERAENYKARLANASLRRWPGGGTELKEGKAATMGTSLPWID